jgi:hypothetical protein
VAAGLSADQLTKLSEAANNASLALGRDLTDSFNRLVRGVTKAEPELLDELGIILRLDDATRKYADSLGIAQGDLTTFQRQQAVANEVLTQAEEKYGKIAEIIDPTGQALNRFLASFDSVANSIQQFATSALAPLFDLLAKNTGTLLALVSALGLGLVKAITPALPEFKDLSEVAKESEGRIREAAKEGSKLGDALKKGASIGANELKTLEKAALAKNSTVLQGSKKEREALLRDLQIYSAQHNLTMANNAKGFSKYVLVAKAQLKLLQLESGKTIGLLKFLGAGLGKALNLVPWIGAILLAIDIFKELYNSIRPVNEELERSTAIAEETASSVREINKELEKQIQIRSAVNLTLKETTVAISNSLSSADALNKLYALQSIPVKDTEEYRDALSEVKTLFENLGKLDPRFKEFGEEIKETGNLSAESAKKFAKTSEEIRSAGTAFENLPKTLEAINSKLKEIGGVSADPLAQAAGLLKQASAELDESVIGADEALKQKQEAFQEAAAEEQRLTERLAKARKDLESRGLSGGFEQRGIEKLEQELALAEKKKKASQDALAQAGKERGELTEQSREIKDQAALFKKFAGIRKASQDALIANELKSAKLRTAGVTIEQKRTNLEADRLDIANSLLKATEKRDLVEATLASKKKGCNQDEIAAAQLVFDRAEANLALEEEKARVKREGLDVAGKTLDIEEESARLADSAKSIEAVKIANEVLQIKKQQLDVEQKILAAEKSVSNSRLKIFENEAKLKSLQETGSLELNPKDQLKLDLDTAKATFEFAIREAALKK